MLKFWILCCFLFKGLVNADNDSCARDAAIQAWSCAHLWGYHPSRGLNFTSLIQYCRTPERTDAGQCTADAYVGCLQALPEPMIPVLPRYTEMLSQGLDYLCSRVETIEDNQECLYRKSASVHDCELNAGTEVSRGHGQEDHISLLRRMARAVERCIYDLLKTGCNSETANLIGNFIYAVSTYIYE